jgi:hypothetical protein
VSVSLDWKARAEREAAALLDEMDIDQAAVTRDMLVALLAIAWVQGVNLGSHETLALVETSFDRMRAEL